MEVTPEFLQQQIHMAFDDIPPDAVKIGMVPSGTLIETIAHRLTAWDAVNIVVDPVIVSKNRHETPPALTAGGILRETGPRKSATKDKKVHF